MKPFQFPLAERTSCNIQACAATQAQSDLSVSSSGTNELQHQKSPIRICAISNFQFPLAERTSCNEIFERQPD